MDFRIEIKEDREETTHCSEFHPIDSASFYLLLYYQTNPAEYFSAFPIIFTTKGGNPMKQLKQLFLILMALLLALLPAAGTLAEARPEEAPAELFGSPWVNSMVTGNLPDTAPAPQDDLYTAVNYETIAAHQDDTFMPISTGTAEVQMKVTALLQDESLTAAGLDQLMIFMEQAADTDALREAGITPVAPYLERIDAAATLEELNALLTAEDFPFSPYLAMPVAPLALNEENGVWIYPALALSSDYMNGANYYTETVEDTAGLLQKASAMDRTLYMIQAPTILGVEAGETAGFLVDMFNMEVSYVKEGYSETTAVTADYGYISDAPQRLAPEDLDGLCSRFPLSATLKKFGKDKAPAFIIPYPA